MDTLFSERVGVGRYIYLCVCLCICACVCKMQKLCKIYTKKIGSKQKSSSVNLPRYPEVLFECSCVFLGGVSCITPLIGMMILNFNTWGDGASPLQVALIIWPLWQDPLDKKKRQIAPEFFSTKLVVLFSSFGGTGKPWSWPLSHICEVEVCMESNVT